VKRGIVAFVGLVLLAQQPKTIQQDAHGGQCNNVVAQGAVTLNCSGLNDAEAKVLLNLSRRILAEIKKDNHVDADALYARLDQCVALAADARSRAMEATRGVIKTYSFDGTFVRTENRVTNHIDMRRDPPIPEFEKMKTLQTEGKWEELIKLSEPLMKEKPEWLTPYVLAAVGYAKTGRAQKALELLVFVRDQAGANPEYAQVPSLIEQAQKQLGGH
jgi:hypothetical protein